MNIPAVALMSLLLLGSAQTPKPFRSDSPIQCSDCAAWNARREPERLFGNSYYVGTAGLSSLLVISDQGHILLDGGLPQSAPLIDENIRKLGFRIADVKLILNSHAHYDHAAGIAALQRASGATVVASGAGAKALERGGPTPDDPQFNYGPNNGKYPAVKNVRVVADGDTVRLGPLAVTMHFTPGHTPGSTTWSWRSCEGSKCQTIVYADSLNAISAPNFRFTGDSKRVSIVPSLQAKHRHRRGTPLRHHRLGASQRGRREDMHDVRSRRAETAGRPDRGGGAAAGAVGAAGA